MKIQSVIVGLTVCVSSAMATPIIIDSFNYPSGGQAVCAGAGCGLVPATSSQSVTGVIGGERDMRVVRLSGSGQVVGNANAFDLGELTFGSVSAAGTLFLQYDGPDNDPNTISFLLGGGAGLNFIGQVGVRYLITDSVDTGGTVTFRFYTSAGNYIQGTDIVPAGAPAGLRVLNFSGFSTTGVFDPSAVRAIEVTIVGNNNLDLTIDFLETFDIPEPATSVLVGLGLLFTAFGLRRRRASALRR